MVASWIKRRYSVRKKYVTRDEYDEERKVLDDKRADNPGRLGERAKISETQRALDEVDAAKERLDDEEKKVTKAKTRKRTTKKSTKSVTKRKPTTRRTTKKSTG